MREIKFRAWIPRDQYETEPVMEMCYDLAFEDYEPINDLLSSVDHLMQYTGLKDKNGVEIYEGDILKLDGRHRTPQGVYIDVSGVMEWEENRNGWTQFSPIERFEVIGNIYENPGLLQDS